LVCASSPGFVALTALLGPLSGLWAALAICCRISADGLRRMQAGERERYEVPVGDAVVFFYRQYIDDYLRVASDVAFAVPHLSQESCHFECATFRHILSLDDARYLDQFQRSIYASRIQPARTCTIPIVHV
jgi:hypothetical protein